MEGKGAIDKERKCMQFNFFFFFLIKKYLLYSIMTFLDLLFEFVRFIDTYSTYHHDFIILSCAVID